MPRDYANIYNLSDADRKAEIKHLWDNSIPGTEDLAKNILRKIGEDEYPYVLSVEASYGMGKTYFFSRFCEYAKKNGFNCVYISAWENDYQPTPFCFIAKEILKYLDALNKPVIKSTIEELKKKGLEVIKKLLSSSHLQLGIQTGIASAGIDIDLDKLYQSFIEPKDEIKEFKQELEKILIFQKIEPLILIIDELDRCRPDYALKTLEIIKHFFDIANLYVILPINKEAIMQAVESIYGPIKNSENYLRKLITENYFLPSADKDSYRKIIEIEVNRKSLKSAISNKYIEENDDFNGFNTAINNLVKYAFRGKLTYREVLKVCREFVSICNKINDKIFVEYLAYKICNKYKKIELNFEHPFNEANSKTITREKIVTINDMYNLTGGLSSCLNYDPFEEDYRPIVKTWETRNNSFETYEKFYNYIDSALEYKDKILHHSMRTCNGEDRFKHFFEVLEKAKDNALNYQKKYGSTDNDNETKAYYDKIIENPLCIYKDIEKAS